MRVQIAKLLTYRPDWQMEGENGVLANIRMSGAKSCTDDQWATWEETSRDVPQVFRDAVAVLMQRPTLSPVPAKTIWDVMARSKGSHSFLDSTSLKLTWYYDPLTAEDRQRVARGPPDAPPSLADNVFDVIGTLEPQEIFRDHAYPFSMAHRFLAVNVDSCEEYTGSHPAVRKWWDRVRWHRRLAPSLDLIDPPDAL